MGNTVRRMIKFEVLYDLAHAKIPGQSWEKRVYKKDDMKEFFRLCLMLDELFSHSGVSSKQISKQITHAVNRSFNSPKQNCVVKCRYGNSVAAHKRFLQQYLPQNDKNEVEEKPELFSSETVDAAFLDEYEKNMDDLHFRFIISPENQKVDNKALVKTLIKRMELITGYKFSWIAAEHKNTDHPHAHLLINGVDRRGNKVHFDKYFLQSAMREQCQDICTLLAGHRSPEEIRERKERLFSSYRFCTLDAELEAKERPAVTDAGRAFSLITTGDERLLKRLRHLENIGLAEKKDDAAGTYLMEANWADKLKTMGRYNTFLTARNLLKDVSPDELYQYTADAGAIQGKVTKIFRMNDEDSWAHALVVENVELNKAWFVPLYQEADQKLYGKTISCVTAANRRGLLRPTIRVLDDGVNRNNR